MNICYANLAIVLTALILGGCSQEPVADQPNPFGEDTIATIDGAPVYASVFERYSSVRLQKSAADLSDEEREVLTEELIQFYLMADAAEDAGLTGEQEVAIDLELQRLQFLSRIMASRYLEENPVTEAALQLAYEENVSQLSGMQYKARHILVTEEAEALDVIQELQSGSDFQELAVSRSTGPSGPSGGDLGWFSADTMVPPFATAVSAMEVGTFSDEPVQTRFGWHVILLEDVVDQQPPGLEAVRADVTTFVEQRKIEEYLGSLSETTEIQIGEPAAAP